MTIATSLLSIILAFSPIEKGMKSTFSIVDDSLIPPKRWTEVAPMPIGTGKYGVKQGGWLSTGEQEIYAGKGNKSGDFYAYNPSKNTWTSLAQIPNMDGKFPSKGTRGVYIGNGEVLLSVGNNTNAFWKYKRGSWERTTDIPDGPSGKRIKGGNDMVFVQNEQGNFVYVLRGYKTEFWKFDVNKDAWFQLPNAPTGRMGKYNEGSFLVYDGNNRIYAHKAKYSSGSNHEMAEFDVSGDTWYSKLLPGMPLMGRHNGSIKSKRLKDGGSGAWVDGKLLALKGGNTQQSFGYSPLSNEWTELDTIPSTGSSGKRRRVNKGGDLVSCNGILYALKGNKTLEMWGYGRALTLEEVVRRDQQVQSEAKSLGPTTSNQTVMTKQEAIFYGVREQIRARVNTSGRVISEKEWKKGNLPAGVYFIFNDKGDRKIERLVVTN
ncbi:MAG: hypothetical protein NTX24_05285 [Candidatus Pacearchaeota archaeon]|nr:hypothetical protein [Candidatus Pacearchaeota archaeon]